MMKFLRKILMLVFLTIYIILLKETIKRELDIAVKKE